MNSTLSGLCLRFINNSAYTAELLIFNPFGIKKISSSILFSIN